MIIDNIIHNLHFVLHTGFSDAHYLQERCSRLVSSRLQNVLNAVLEEASQEGVDLQLDAVTIDVGLIPLENFDYEMIRKLTMELRRIIRGLCIGPDDGPLTGTHVSQHLDRDNSSFSPFERRSDTHAVGTSRHNIMRTAQEDTGAPAQWPFKSGITRADARHAAPVTGRGTLPSPAGQVRAPARSGKAATENARPVPGSKQLSGGNASSENRPDTPATLPTEAQLEQFISYLQNGFFPRPSFWVGPGQTDRWLLSLLATLSDPEQTTPSHGLKSSLARACLYPRAKNRLSRTFSLPALEALTDWLGEALVPLPSSLTVEPDVTNRLVETAFRLLVQQSFTPPALTSFIPLSEEVEWPTSPAIRARWQTLLHVQGSAVPSTWREELTEQLRAPPGELTKGEMASPALSASPSSSVISTLPRHKSDIPSPDLVAIQRNVPTTPQSGRVLPQQLQPASARSISEPSVFSSGVSVPIADAGACLLWPLLPHLMAQLALTDNNVFTSVEARNRAVCSLDHLIWCDGQAAEWRTTFTRWLCGWNEQDEFDWYFPDDSAEQHIDEFMKQLTRLVPEWHRCQPGDLRAFFLQRPGELLQEAGRWTLRPEESAEDILLQGLPWPVRELRMPWRDDILFVNWL